MIVSHGKFMMVFILHAKHYLSGGYGAFAALKTYNKDLKTLLAIGGWNEGSSRFSPLVADPARRQSLIR